MRRKFFATCCVIVDAPSSLLFVNVFAIFFKKALTIGSGKLATELNAQIDSINSKEEEVTKLTDSEIKESFQKLKTDIDQTDKHELEVEAFSLVREAAKRTIKTSTVTSNKTAS